MTGGGIVQQSRLGKVETMSKQKAFMSDMFQILLMTFIMLSASIGCTSMNIDTYDGDGTIESLGSWPFSKGFTIRLGSFSTDEAFQSTYKITNITKSHKSYYIGLEITSQNTEYDIDDFKSKIRGYLSIKIESEDGGIIVEWKDEIQNWHFSATYNSDFTRYFITPNLRSLGSNYFDYSDIKDKGHLKVNVTFFPVKDSKKLQAIIKIKTGGYY